MKNRLFFIVLIFLLSVSFGAQRQISAEELAKKLPQIESVECKFKQEKTIKNLPKPLVSNGNFKFIKGEGVYFETLYPVKSVVSYTNKDYKQINDIILAILNQKYSKIDKEFDFFYSKENNVWLLILQPKKGAKSEKYLDSLTIEGEEIINKITILTKDGNKTVQWFLREN